MTENAIENLIIGIIGSLATAVILLVAQKYWPRITDWFAERFARSQFFEGPEFFESLSNDLENWEKRLNGKIFILRLLPYELTRVVFKKLPLGEYKAIMGPYVRTMEKIIKLGGDDDKDYWDMTIVGRCCDTDVDAATCNALQATYFPLDAWDMNTGSEEGKVFDPVNTSTLALSCEPIEQGIFLIGEIDSHTRTDDFIERIQETRFRVGFSFELNPSDNVFDQKWKPKKCTRMRGRKRLNALRDSWIKIWEQLPVATVIPPNPVPWNASININVDDVVEPKHAAKWRSVLNTWFLPKEHSCL